MGNPTTLPGHAAGFTLVESFITLSVAAILMTIAIPSFQEMIASNRIATARNGLVSYLHLARSESIKRGTKTVLCPSTNGTECLNGYQWQQGFMVFVDLDKDNKFDKDETLLAFHQGDFEGIRIETSTGRRKISYKPNGSAAGTNATFTLCDLNDKVDPRAVIISNTGRPRLSDKRSDGSPLNCD
jgi:type IV fimbrial biogenesis protein FimT